MTKSTCPNCDPSFLESLSLGDEPDTLPSAFLNNSPLSREQTTSIEDAIKVTAAELGGMDEEISRLERTLEGMKEARQRKANFIERQKTLLSPVRRMPQDLWRIIFETVSEKSLSLSSMSDIVPSNSSLLTTRAPILLTRVCSYWRHIAIKTPRLWSTICLEVNTPVSEGLALLLQMFLARSGTMPLRLQIVLEAKVPSDVNLFRLYDALSIHAFRWQIVNLNVPFECIESEFWNLSSTKFNILENMAIKYDDHFNYGLNWSPFSRSPVLKDLHLLDWEAGRLTESMFNWSSLTSVNVQTSSTRTLFDVLRWCPNLKVLKIEVQYNDDDDVLSDPIHHEKLENFTIRNGSSRTEFGVLHNFTLPNVTCFTLDDNNISISDQHNRDIASFLSKNGDALTSVNLQAASYKFLGPPEPLKKLTSLKIGVRKEQQVLATVSFIDDVLADSEGSAAIFLPAVNKLHIGVQLKDPLQLPFLCNKVAMLSRQVSPNSQPVGMPLLKSVILEAVVQQGSFEFHLVTQLKELKLDCLEVKFSDYFDL